MPSNRNGSRNAAKSAAKMPTKSAEPRFSRFTPGAYFRDRTVLITGASSGIGRDLALAFAKMGAKVALMARRKALLETLADEIAAAVESCPRPRVRGTPRFRRARRKQGSPVP
jgi:NADPH:quinone reductase-like Zn-dependent oxidoreductase